MIWAFGWSTEVIVNSRRPEYYLLTRDGSEQVVLSGQMTSRTRNRGDTTQSIELEMLHYQLEVSRESGHGDQGSEHEPRSMYNNDMNELGT